MKPVVGTLPDTLSISAGEEVGLPTGRRFWAALSIWFAIMLSILDASIVNVALPSISMGLQISAASSVWVVNAYQVAILMALLPLALASDILGYKPIYLVGTMLFIGAALGSVFATSLTMLALSRYGQGIGAAALMVASGALVRTIYPPALVPRGIAYNAMAVSIASASGPAVGALVLSFADWRMIFAVSLPFGLLALAVGTWAIPATKSVRRPFDFASTVLCGICFGSIFLIFTDLAQGTISWKTAVEAGLAGSSALFLVRRSVTGQEQMIPLDLLRLAVLRSAYAMSATVYAVMMLITLSLPFILHQRFHFSIGEVGLLMVPMPIGIAAAAFIAGRLLDPNLTNQLGIYGLAILAAGAAFLAALQPGAPVLLIITAAGICGIGFGLFQVPNNHVMLGTAPRARGGAASALMSMSRLAGQTLGALLAALLFRRVGAASDVPIIVAAVIALVAVGGSLRASHGSKAVIK